MNKGIYNFEKDKYVKTMKRLKVKWVNVILILITIYLVYSLIGMVAAKPITKTTPAGEYQCKGFPYGIKVCSGSKSVADYLGVWYEN